MSFATRCVAIWRQPPAEECKRVSVGFRERTYASTKVKNFVSYSVLVNFDADCCHKPIKFYVYAAKNRMKHAPTEAALIIG